MKTPVGRIVFDGLPAKPEGQTDGKYTVTGRISRTEIDPDYSFGGHQHRKAIDFTNAKGETLHVELPDDKKLRHGDAYAEGAASLLAMADYSAIEQRVMAHYAVEGDMPMPERKVGKHPALALGYMPPAPLYERFVCKGGPMDGRGVIVQMPETRICGYDLYKSGVEGGEHVAIFADLLA